MKVETSADLLAHTNQVGDCLEWSKGRFDKGYGAVWHQGKLWRAHRLAWTLIHGPIPAGAVVRHSCDNPPCINPDHLLTGSHADNIADKFKRGRHPHAGKFERTDEIRQRCSDGARRRWERMTEAERAEFGAAMGIAQRGKRRGPYKGRATYAQGYKPVA